jgi:hypothetical protein
MMTVRTLAAAALVALSVPLADAAAQQTPAAGALTPPEQFFGHRIGADYVLPNYQQLVAYWRVLDGESERMNMVPIGESAEGRTQYMAIVTSPANHASLERYRTIARRMARADGVSEEQARALAEEGRAVVWIDGGLHSTEVLGAQQLMETVWQLVSRNDAETRRILDDVIVLAVHANPDGHDLVSDWYMRRDDPLARSPEFDIPRLYQKYIGHDNNRDFYLSSQPETTNMNRVLYREWFPQIVYNHHQTGPVGQVMWAPPFREPYNHRIHPLVRLGIETVASSMHTRFITEKKPGVGRGEAAGYSTWWNGGLRTTTYFHNMIGILTETKGNPTPAGARAEIPLIPHLQLSTTVMPLPIDPQPVTFRDVVDYSVTANYAVLDVASRNRQLMLYNIWRMGMDAIERGSRDSWTHQPGAVASLTDAMLEVQQRSYDADGRWVDAPGMAEACMRVRTGMPVALQRPCLAGDDARRHFDAVLRAPELREPRGYILPADQPDFATATKFIHALQKNGVRVQQATAPFTVAATRYPAGSYVVRTAQAFGPHILDMFEPQDHPHDTEYPGGPPIHPYDAAGYTLAFQMGVQFDRILDAFDGPFEDVDVLAPVPAGRIAGSGDDGFLVSSAQNDAFRLVSRVLTDGGRVYRVHAPLQSAGGGDGSALPAGSFYIPRAELGAAANGFEALVRQLGIVAWRTGARPAGALAAVAQPRIALWDEYGGSMPSGWTRWLMEQFEVPFTVVYPQELDAGGLREKYDAIVFVDGAIPARDGAAPTYADDMPAELRHTLGRVSVARTVPQLRAFLEQGGHIVTIGSSTVLARHLGLPVEDHLVTSDEAGGVRPLKGSEFFIPASVLRVRVDPSQPLAYGMEERVDFLFDRSPVFRAAGGATQNDAGGAAAAAGAATRGQAAPVTRVAWYDTAEPLRSGWAYGQHRLQGGLAAADVRVGEGRLFLFGPEILYRAQPHGTFKLFFNALYFPERGPESAERTEGGGRR